MGDAPSVVGGPPSIAGVGLRLVLDADVFDVGRLATGGMFGAPSTVWLGGALRLDGDLAARLRERAGLLRQAPAEQRAALELLASGDPRTAARVRVLAAMRDLAARARGNADWSWDPRIDAAVELAEAVLPSFAPAREPDPAAPAPDARRLAAALTVVGNRAGPVLDLHVAVLAMQAPLLAARDHAERIAARTRDVAMAARYRRLAVACSELAAAARVALGGS